MREKRLESRFISNGEKKGERGRCQEVYKGSGLRVLLSVSFLLICFSRTIHREKLEIKNISKNEIFFAVFF